MAVKLSPKNFVGRWKISAMSEFDDSYSEEGESDPILTLGQNQRADFYGEYNVGLSTGNIDGAVREFGGESVLIFGFEGTDEMDPVSGGGWARLISRDELEGEFINHLGEFRANRSPARKRAPRKPAGRLRGKAIIL